MRQRIGLLIALVTVLVELGAPPAHAVVPGPNGRIVFARCIRPFKCGSSSVPTWEIVAASPNDTHEIVLAGPYTRDVFDDHFIANWSPNGTRVIFMADLGNGQAIWEVNADGTNLHAVWRPPHDGTGIDDGPAFTPDGAHIVFTRCCPEGYGYSLWMINADGTGLRDVTKEPQVNGDGRADTTPQVSPDGKKIVFNRCEPCVVATVNIDGTNMRNLTDNTVFESERPNWSPNSRRIVFGRHDLGDGIDVAIMRADGSGLRRVTSYGLRNGPMGAFDPSFSPDGTRIAFVRFTSTGGTDLYTIRPDGSRVRQVTRTPDLEFNPEWGVATR